MAFSEEKTKTNKPPPQNQTNHKKKNPNTTQNKPQTKQNKNTHTHKKPKLLLTPQNPPCYVSTTGQFEYKSTCCKPLLHLEVKTFKVSLFQSAVCLNCAIENSLSLSLREWKTNKTFSDYPQTNRKRYINAYAVPLRIFMQRNQEISCL